MGLVAIVVVLAGIGFLASALATTTGHRPARAGIAVVAAAVIVVTLGVIALGSVPRLRSDGSASRGSAGATTTTTARRSPEPVGPTAPDVRDAVHIVDLRATAGRTPHDRVPVVEDLADGDVLRLHVTGFDGGQGDFVRQCRSTPAGYAGCRNHFPIVADHNGDLLFQYQLQSGGSGQCGASASCVVVVGPDEGPSVAIATVFGARAPAPARIEIVPAPPYDERERIDVTVRGLAPRSRAGLASCTPTCGSLTTIRADADGVARARIRLGDRCEGRACALALFGTGARDSATTLRFEPEPRPDHAPGRILGTLGGAAVLLLVAWRTIRRTDWTPPSEAATPELDAAEL